MFKTKVELDQHVRNTMARIRSEKEKNLRSFTIAKMYFKLNEYLVAEQFVTSYLSVKDDNDQAHKLLGQCYLQQKKYNKALAAFQRSLQLNPKQPDLLGEVCQLFVDDKDLNTNRAKYWCDLAENEKVNHDAVLSLRLKLMNTENLDTNQVEEMIQKEISLRSHDINLRIRLVRYLIEQNKTREAFQNIYQLETSKHSMLAQSAEWYNVVWLLLGKYEQLPNVKNDWQFWLLTIRCLERQVYLSFTSSNEMTLPNGGITETANLLFLFDQYLFKVSQLVDTLNQQKELVARFIEHYQGQLCLYAASLLIKRELIENKYNWKETIKTCLPMLLLAYQSSKPDSKQQWMKHCDEHGSQLLQQWNKEGSFHCVQAGLTLFACIEENNENSSQLSNLIGNSSAWKTTEALIDQIRQTCTDKNWRRGIFNQLFCNSDQKIKQNSSHFMRCTKLSEPIYELPTYGELEQHGETAQYLNPQSLEHMVYLCLGNDNLANVRVNFFNGLNFSTHNLSFCGAESLNQLDIETFLYAATLQLESRLKVERLGHDCYHQGSVPKPKVLPFVNMRHQMCTDEQIKWWLTAYKVYKDLANENLAEIRATLQYGIEVVRGINGPKIDMLIVFKLGKIFETRASDANKPVEKGMLEARAEKLYKYGLYMLKSNNKGVLEPFKRYFKYSNGNSSAQEREIFKLAEDAVSFLAAKYFKNSEYEDLIEEFNGIDLPFATYFQFETYRKLDKTTTKTPKKNKNYYIDKAIEYLNQTEQLLKSSKVDANHPLNSVVPFELNKLQQIKSKLTNEQINNSSSYEDAETEFGIGDSSQQYNTSIRSRRDNSIVSQRNVEVENMTKQILNMMISGKKEKEEIHNQLKDMHTQLKDIHSQLKEFKDRLTLIDENIAKKSIPPSRDEDASNALEDLYIIEDELQNQLYSNQQQQQTLNNMHGSTYSQQHSTMGQRLHTPTAVGSGGMVNLPGAGIPSYNNALYGNYAMNYYAQQLMMPPQPQPPAPPVMGTHQSQISNRNPMGLSYMDSPMNFNTPGLNPSLLMQPSTQDSRSSNLFGLLNQNSQQQPQLMPSMQQQQQPPPPLGPPMHQQPPSLGQSILQQQQPPPTQPPSMQSTTFALPSQSMTIGPKIQPTNPQIAPPSVSLPSTLPMTFNKSLNNAPVEKGPPVNVVITSSDPLPTTSITMQPQPTLSVTIPSHHIKSSLISTKTTTNTNFPMIGTSSTVTFATPITSPFTMKFTSPLTTTTAAPASTTTTTGSPMTFSFRPPSPKSTDDTNLDNSNTSDLHKSEHEIEYDPRPDFQPIIPLPDEIEVKTGEENEQVMFSARSKLFRYADKEWKERGVGDLKILKNNENGTSRILMRRDQTHKICANHRITSELNLTKPKNSEKGFIWAANDFADEELKLEKFLVRFKDMAMEKQFETAFNVARDEDIALSTKTQSETNKSKPLAFGVSKMFNDNKTSTPTLKSAENPSNILKNSNPSALPKTLFSATKADDTTTKSPFKDLNLYLSPIDGAKTFDNLFANLNNSQNEGDDLYYSLINNSEANIQEPKPETNNHNKSDNEDEYVPTAQFQPVIPLPDLVEVTTGEENEIVLFEHRAKLLRFDKTTSEWKERGLGNMKVLQDKNDANNVRLVMRREIIHKLCCNQRLYKDTSFKYTKNSKTSLMWAGQDFSENELQVETLTIRFKTADICKQFLDVITAAQAKMTSAANEENANKNPEPAKTTAAESTPTPTTKGFGDKFKPKAGSWSCSQCYTSNTADKLYCASCEAPKDETVPKKDLLATSSSIAAPTKPTFNFGFANLKTNTTAAAATQSFVATEALQSAKQQQAPKVTPAVGFGDKFKPKEGSWSCEQCYTSNTADKLHCASCEAPKDKTVPKKEANNLLSLTADSNAPKFSFGFGGNTALKPPTTTTAEAKPNKQEVTSNTTGFGDKFKPKAGSWSCSECYLSNSVDENYCKACDHPKDSTVPKKEPANILAPSNPSAKFSFGFKAVGAGAAVESETPSSFSFGTKPAEVDNKTTTNIFGSNSASTNLFASKLGGGESKTFSFSPATSTTSDSTTTTGTIAKSTFSFSLPSKTIESSSGGGANEFSLDKKDFNFVLKPKSPAGKAKGLNASGGAADDDDDDVAEEEENNTYFTPVIPLPDKIEVKTGEEDEEVLYSHRAKLFRFIEGEWKERGLGDVKILRHKITKKLRVVMRRELVLKICLNHILNEDVIYKNKDDKSWLFAINDYSEGEVEMNKLCLLRFKNKEISDGFRKAVKDSLAGNAKAIEETNTAANDHVQESDVSSSIKEVQISDENKRKADTLSLPYSFFDVSSLVDCPGCRGCDPDKFIFSNPPSSNQNPDNEIPLNMKNLTIMDSIPKPNIFGGGQKFESSNAETNNVFSGFGNSGASFSFTEALNSISNNKNTPEFVFGGGNTGSNIFGDTNANSFSLFGNKKDPLKKSVLQNSIFGGGQQQEEVQGTDATKSNNIQATTEGSNATQVTFGTSNNPVFGSKPFGTSIFGGGGLQPKTNQTTATTDNSTKSIFGSIAKPAQPVAPSQTTGFMGLSNKDSLSFADLAKQTTQAQTPSTFMGLSNTESLSFGDLAKQSTQLPTTQPSTGGFIGLTHTNAFSSFKNPNDEADPDPHFEPIIPLPDKIALSTGEEDENVVFGERATLFRYDQDKKEWKERGVGELKILQHKTKGTYRMVMRREQIFKLVLNHAVGADFSFKPMGNSPKAFIWATLNYAEEGEGSLENLSCRFRNVDTANKFNAVLTNCIEIVKSRAAELEPKD